MTLPVTPPRALLVLRLLLTAVLLSLSLGGTERVWAAHQSGSLVAPQPGDPTTVAGCPEPGYLDALAGLPTPTRQALTAAHCRYEAAALTIHPERDASTPSALYACAKGQVCHLGAGLWYASPLAVVVNEASCRQTAQVHREIDSNKGMSAQLNAEREANPWLLAIDEACGLR